MATFTWPSTWYKQTSASFYLRSRNQSTESPWTSARSVNGPHAQYWVGRLQMIPLTPLDDPKIWEVSAFFSRLDGSKNLLRIGHTVRQQPQYNSEVVAGMPQTWSDGTLFADGTGFSPLGLLPPTVFLNAGAAMGDNTISVAGLPASTSRVLRRGDLIEIRAGGIATDTPHLYEVVTDGSSNASGVTGVEIRPRLRAGVAAGDTVVLNNPTSVFRCVDDNQGEIEVASPVIGGFGFSIVEAII